MGMIVDTTTIERIQEMEQKFENVSTAIKTMKEALSTYKKARKDIRQLTEYYESQQWMDDFNADSEGLLPQDLKRGVLSEDGLWNLLDDDKQLQERMSKLVVLLLVFLCLPFTLVQAQHIVALGDSNTWLAGDSCTNPRGWITVVKEQMQPTSCRSYARSGATWTHTDSTKYNTKEYTALLGNDNVIYNQVNRLREDCTAGRQPLPDLILILAGTNDMWFQAKRPKAFSRSAEEVCGDTVRLYPTLLPNKVLSMAEAIRYDYELLRDFCPTAKIVLLTPMQATKVSRELVMQTGELIDQCGALLQMPVIRLDEVGIDSEEEQRQKRYTSDGVHTNEEGATLIGSYVVEKLGF